MDVTRDNFSAAADELESLLKTCKFVAFDEEMTGIRLGETEPAWNDTVQERYAKMKRVAEHYLLMQVGICVFHEEEDPERDGTGTEGVDQDPAQSSPTTRLVARPFNFYVFPAAHSKHQLRMSADTAHFHVEHQMDFNKWIKQGVPFLSADHYNMAAEKLLADAPPSQSSERKRTVVDREDDKTFIADAFAGLDAWVKGEASDGGAGGDVGEARHSETNASGKATDVLMDSAVESGNDAGTQQREFEMPDCNAFLRRVMYEELEARYPELTAESRPVGFRKKLVVMRLTDEEKEARAKEQKRVKLRALDDSAGFLRVFRMLSAARKPIVGHNCLYDLMFLYSHFQGSLPQSAEGFKQALHELFPHIWDTKYLSSMSAGKYSDTQLGPLYLSCVQENDRSKSDSVRIVMAEGFEKYSAAAEGGAAAHEAAYDAYMTGVVLARLQADGLCETHVPAARQNRMYLMRSLFCLNLEGVDAITTDGTLLFLSGFDARFKTQDLVALFPDLRVTVRWIDDVSCIVVVSDPAPICPGDEGREEPASKERVKTKDEKEKEARKSVFDNLAGVVAQVEERVAARHAQDEASSDVAQGPAPCVDMSCFKVGSIDDWVSAAADRGDRRKSLGPRAQEGGVGAEASTGAAAEQRVKALEAELENERAKTAKLSQDIAVLQQQVAHPSTATPFTQAEPPSTAVTTAAASKKAKSARGRAVKQSGDGGGAEELAARGESGVVGKITPEAEEQAAAAKPRAVPKRKAAEQSVEAAGSSPVATRASARRKK